MFSGYTVKNHYSNPIIFKQCGPALTILIEHDSGDMDSVLDYLDLDNGELSVSMDAGGRDITKVRYSLNAYCVIMRGQHAVSLFSLMTRNGNVVPYSFDSLKDSAANRINCDSLSSHLTSRDGPRLSGASICLFYVKHHTFANVSNLAMPSLGGEHLTLQPFDSFGDNIDHALIADVDTVSSRLLTFSRFNNNSCALDSIMYSLLLCLQNDHLSAAKLKHWVDATLKHHHNGWVHSGADAGLGMVHMAARFMYNVLLKGSRDPDTIRYRDTLLTLIRAEYQQNDLLDCSDVINALLGAFSNAANYVNPVIALSCPAALFTWHFRPDTKNKCSNCCTPINNLVLNSKALTTATTKKLMSGSHGLIKRNTVVNVQTDVVDSFIRAASDGDWLRRVDTLQRLLDAQLMTDASHCENCGKPSSKPVWSVLNSPTTTIIMSFQHQHITHMNLPRSLTARTIVYEFSSVVVFRRNHWMVVSRNPDSKQRLQHPFVWYDDLNSNLSAVPCESPLLNPDFFIKYGIQPCIVFYQRPA